MKRTVVEGNLQTLAAHTWVDLDKQYAYADSNCVRKDVMKKKHTETFV